MDSEESHGLPTSRYINLNVGGVKYTTSRETLTRYQDSMLWYMFTQENIPLAKDERGRFMIDRDGRLFSYILNYLRDGELTLPEDFSEHRQLLKEARFYQLTALEEKLKDAVTAPTVVSLIVGGVKYLTTRATLTKYPESVPSRMFHDIIPGIDRDEYGHFIIDRDGTLFRYILNFLRDDKMGIPDGFIETDQLIGEITFFELSEYVRNFGIGLIIGGAHHIISKETLRKLPGIADHEKMYMLSCSASIIHGFPDWDVEHFKVIVDNVRGKYIDNDPALKQKLKEAIGRTHGVHHKWRVYYDSDLDSSLCLASMPE